MNASRLLRAVVTGLTLLALMWLLGRFGPHPRAEEARQHRKSLSSGRAELAGGGADLISEALSPIRVSSLPFVADDNTCFSADTADLSAFTGMLSASPVRKYAIEVARQTLNLRVSVEPHHEYFDPSLVLFDSSGGAIAALDGQEAGWVEDTVIASLPPGIYYLTVGGYDGDCGPYRLTVSADPSSVAELRDFSLRRGSNGTVIRWKTFAEVDVARFGLYRVGAAGDRERIATFRSHGSPADFADYRFLDRQSGADSSYEIEMVSDHGRTQRVAVVS